MDLSNTVIKKSAEDVIDHMIDTYEHPDYMGSWSKELNDLIRDVIRKVKSTILRMDIDDDTCIEDVINDKVIQYLECVYDLSNVH